MSVLFFESKLLRVKDLISFFDVVFDFLYEEAVIFSKLRNELLTVLSIKPFTDSHFSNFVICLEHLTGIIETVLRIITELHEVVLQLSH